MTVEYLGAYGGIDIIEPGSASLGTEEERNLLISEVAQEALQNAFYSLEDGSGVQIAWFHSKRDFSHVAIVIDDKVYGFLCCIQTPEIESFQKALKKVAALQPGQSAGKSHCVGITFQHIDVSTEQKEDIEKWCQRAWVPALTCMHAASFVLRGLDTEIPYRTMLFPELSRLYLKEIKPSRLSDPCTIGTIPDNILGREYRFILGFSCLFLAGFAVYLGYRTSI